MPRKSLQLVVLLLPLVVACGSAEAPGAGDGGATDGGSDDGGATDGGATDGGSDDGGATDGGASDGGSDDGGSDDGGATDGGSGDGGSPAGAGVVVLAGGGSEGDVGDADAWSASLYGALLEAGDVTGDGQVVVAVLSANEETDWLPGYLEWLGADDAFNLQVADAPTAADPATVDLLAGSDAVFIKGGDQGEYYDLWNDSPLETALRELVDDRGGSIGGTSAGAMSLGQWALAGGKDYISDDVLVDSQTSWLDDEDGGSGIHGDFLGLLPDLLIDTHFTERGRLGRLLGAMARVHHDEAPARLLGVGLEQRTGVVVRSGVASVHGDGAVVLLQDGGGTWRRPPGQPLTWTDVSLTALTAGAVVDLASGELLELPDGAVAVTPGAADITAISADWQVQGSRPMHEERCALVAGRAPDAFQVSASTDADALPGAACLLDAHDSDTRGLSQEVALAVLAEAPGSYVMMVARQSGLERRQAAPERLWFGSNADVIGDERATIVLDSMGATWTSRSAVVSPYDAGDGGLRAVGIDGVRLHLLADTVGTALELTLDTREVSTK